MFSGCGKSVLCGWLLCVHRNKECVNSVNSKTNQTWSMCISVSLFSCFAWFSPHFSNKQNLGEVSVFTSFIHIINNIYYLPPSTYFKLFL